jgi:hypothetical protein
MLSFLTWDQSKRMTFMDCFVGNRDLNLLTLHLNLSVLPFQFHCRHLIALLLSLHFEKTSLQWRHILPGPCSMLSAASTRYGRRCDVRRTFLFSGLVKFMWILFSVPVYWMKETVIHAPLRVFTRMLAVQLNFEVTFCKCYKFAY